VLEAEQLGVAVADGGGLARHQVAQVQHAQAVAGALEHDRGVALVDRRLVAAFGLLLLDHHGRELARADLDVEVEQHGLERQRERVHRLDVLPAGIAVALLDGQLEQQAADHPAGAHALEGHRLAGGGLQHRGFVAHCCSLFRMSW